MKKNIASQLNELARTTPTVFEWKEEECYFTGEEMNLSAFGEHQIFDNGKALPKAGN